jgi:hypothetical protein
MSTTAEPLDDQPPLRQETASTPEHPVPAAQDVAETASEPTPASVAKADAEIDTDLLDDAQVEALKGDPDKLRKELQRAFTKKTQKLAELRKDLEPYRDLIAAMRDDPEATIQALARQAGYDLTKPQETPPTAVDPLTEVKTVLAESLGPEYEDLAERLAPAVMRSAELIAKRTIQPLQEAQQTQLQTQVANEAQSEIAKFAESHPDWQQHEAAMNQLAAVLQPKPGLGTQRYLELLYREVTGDKAVAAKTKQTIARMQRSAEESSAQPSAVGADKVSVSTTGPPTFKQAAEFARRGVRLE